MKRAACLKSALLILFTMTFAGLPARAWDEKRPSKVTTPPDFTKGGTPAGKKNDIVKWKHWAMGPTGAYMWVWAYPRTVSSDGATQIYVINIDAKTPADGKLQAADVILGAAGGTEVKPFIRNARRETAAAITEAEKVENKGALNLLVWRTGNTFTTTLRLPVMGTYSRTSPVSCPKTEHIVEQTADGIVRRGLGGGGITECLDALGLLATGEKKYLPHIRELARNIGSPDREISLTKKGIPGAWHTAYQMIFLSEYHLATGDEQVLPALKKLAVTAARGCSGVGTWGHGYAWPELNGGRLHGALGGYGAMNATGLPLTIGLVLARKCGITDSEIDWAIKQSASFLRYFVDKGGIPYGDHDPWLKYYCNNGKNAEAAVLFTVLGDARAASFFSGMTLASVFEREEGHTGPYFSMTWGALGAACGGPEAAAAFMKHMRWYYELQRRPHAAFRYQPVLMGGEEHGKYKNWSCDGVALLHYCLPRKAIYLTGKGGLAGSPLTKNEVGACIDVAHRNIYDDRTVAELLTLLEHRLPVTRQRAAEELARRKDNVVNLLLAKVRSDNRYARYGACVGLRYASGDSAAAADALIEKLLHSKDANLRYYAATAFAHPRGGRGFKKEAKRVVPALLKVAVAEDPADPHRKLQATIAGVLFYGGSARGYAGILPGGKGIETVDRELLIPAVKSMLTNTNGDTRSMVSKLYTQFAEKDLQQLWGDIYRAAKTRAPSGVMFSGGVQANGLKLIADHRFREGIDLAVRLMLEKRWGLKHRFRQALKILVRYGSLGKEHVARIKTTMWPELQYHFKRDPRYKKTIEGLIKTIEESTEKPRLESMAKYLTDADAK